MAYLLGTENYTREEVYQALRLIRDEGLEVGPNDPIAKKLAEAIRVLWKDAPEPEVRHISDEFRKTFGYGHEDKRKTRQPFVYLIRDGWFARLLEYTQEAKSSPQFFFAAAMTMIAAGLPRKPLIAWDIRPMYPNLYTLLVGGSGSGKGVALYHARRIIQPATGLHILGNEGTPPGFAMALARRYAETGSMSDGLILSEELKVLFGTEKYKAALAEWLTDFWDSPAWWPRALVGNPGFALNNVYVNLLAASNMPWLKRLPRDAVLGGFVPRIAIYDTPEDEEPWGVSNPRLHEKLKEELTKTLAKRLSTVPDTLWLDEKGERWSEEWYQGPHQQAYREAANEQVRFWLSRKQALIYKYATVWMLVDGVDVAHIPVEYLERARRVVDWCDDPVARVYHELGTTDEGQVAQDVMSVVIRMGGKVPERKVIRSWLRNKYTSKRIRDTLKALHEDGDLRHHITAMDGKIWEVSK